jgi:two-component system, NarL family, sensor histidine kinase DegS
MQEEISASEKFERLQELVEESRKEYERAQQELKEIDVLIRQTTHEVDRYTQRSAQIEQQVRQIDANLESYPRQEIKTAYFSARDAQMRLLTMRNQVEQLQNKQEALTRYGQQLARFLGVVDTVSDEADLVPSEIMAEAPTATRNIIRIIEAQENERQRLARQMHDGPAQRLTNLILQAEICERLFEADPAQAKTELANLKKAVTATFQRTRDFIVTLRPMMLDDLGLLATLRRYVENFEKKSVVAASLSSTGQERRYPPYYEVTAFRVIQEALNNVEEHAHASNVRVALDFQEEHLDVVVEDDGSGFDVNNALATASQRKMLGLVSMQERAEMLGGTLELDSSIGRGTRIRLSLPIGQ